jgi:hypothetical protein
MSIRKARFQAMTVVGLRWATATDEQLLEPAPSLNDLNVDVTGCTSSEALELQRLVEEAWQRPRHRSSNK